MNENEVNAFMNDSHSLLCLVYSYSLSNSLLIFILFNTFGFIFIC